MYVGIDIGGTKTLVASLTNEGIIRESAKFLTPKDYDDFLAELTKTLDGLKTQDFRAGAIAAPGILDRGRGVVEAFGNLPWEHVHLQRDIEKITHCPMLLENDAKLAALSEAQLLKNKYKRVLYVTLSTGIGYGLVVEGAIDPNIGDAGGRGLMLPHHGQLAPWESFASGSAIVRRFGKRASEITDAATWKIIAHDLAPGFLELIAVTLPDVVVVGGGVGHYFERLHKLLMLELKKHETPMLHIPPLVEAKRPDEAVVYGCYDFAKAHYA
jgi:predicted NBD/HSP70 family sugar kinase